MSFAAAELFSRGRLAVCLGQLLCGVTETIELLRFVRNVNDVAFKVPLEGNDIGKGVAEPEALFVDSQLLSQVDFLGDLLANGEVKNRAAFAVTYWMDF